VLRAKARLQLALISESSLSHLPPFYDEPAPADFRIRVSRSARGIGAKRTPKHRGRRIAALAAAIAVPAVAAPGDWQPIGALAFQEGAIFAPVKPMAFEMPGNSFPGSAFYFLEDAPRMAFAASNTPTPLFDISGTGKADAAQLVQTHGAGPAARSFLSAGGGVSKARALQCLTSAIYYEAASETIGGQRAVAQVVLNRVAHPSYPNSVCGVVYQGSERRTGCQFSFTCDGSLARKPSVAAWDRARMVAQDALLGDVYQPVGLATHYHTIWIHPYWAPSLDPVGTIGAHRFYRWRGAAGKPGAFRASYSGSEPFAAPPVRKASDLAKDAADPVELARQFARDYAELSTELAKPLATAPRSTGQGPAQALAHSAGKGTPAPAPAYSAAVTDRGGERLFKAENLPQASGIRPEYANSGRWISDPK
jgi:spore germination cell wall hydrolase CwlJ-like protein